ncbi:hypothetical protein ACFWBX_27305 [Streptomyces sp. NPDC059991]|uniref:hypothetical protein n=1 Tax=Streptomyces sp. NPDC059991 TaxID=3347028 RepID=UPI0036C9F01C
MNAQVRGLPVADGGELGERLVYALGCGALMCVSAEDAGRSASAVETALGELGQGGLVRVAAAEPGTRRAVVEAVNAGLHPGRRQSLPRSLYEAEAALDIELARRTRPVMVVHAAHRLRSEGLLSLYGRWRAADADRRPFTLVLTGTGQLERVLKRPSLEGLRSHVHIRQHLGAQAAAGRVPPARASRTQSPGGEHGAKPATGAAGKGAGARAVPGPPGRTGAEVPGYIHEEIASQMFHPDGRVTTEHAPAVWTLAHRGYSGSGRLDIWAYTSKSAALRAGAELAMDCGLDEDPQARALFTARAYTKLLERYEATHPDTHLLRVQAAFLQDPGS